MQLSLQAFHEADWPRKHYVPADTATHRRNLHCCLVSKGLKTASPASDLAAPCPYIQIFLLLTLSSFYSLLHTMSNVFTFVKPSAFKPRTEIYQGSFTASSEVEAMQPVYRVYHKGRVLDIAPADSNETPIITCRLEGFRRRRGKLYGSNTIAPINMEGRIKDNWIIHDFEGNQYKWKIKSFRGPAWVLLDENENIIASFDRSAWRRHVNGRLTITKPVSKDFLLIILLTNRLVLRTVQDKETAASAAVAT
ncbi:hypothetical protein DL89DRAFT_268635 [Linderina pennispora]|uniref:Uncharacterized protein n=1 Tax=Linderina pennispora TaxID=61395 RepID=A0A1Y1W3I1_9FUNG|nr:uncharacterized protein DL89DRAFT_268635 [Linderina pennispora]ORX68103.1 hypothetical protein DL89DRAFT_268635 [Linderina pennispora]